MKRKLSITILIALSISCCFGQGFYIEYKMTMEGMEGGGTTKTYYQDGNTRTEAQVTRGNYSKTVVTLMLKATPGKVYLLNEDQKTYDEADVNAKDMDNGQAADYEIKVLGKERVNGYNSNHVQIINLKDSMRMEFWTSTEVNGYADYLKIKTKYTGKDGLNKALAAKGALGFPVRVKAMERRVTFIMDLVKAVRQNSPASFFSLDGYSKASSAAAPTSSPANQQEIMQKLQNMSPEERQKYVQQILQQQQQNQPH